MKNEDLLLALNDLDDDLVLDASQTTPSRFLRRRVMAVLLAATLALTLLGCAYVLTGADWFKAFFQEQAEQPLSEGQSAYIDQRTEDIAQSVTIDGYTLTVESAIADQYTAYVKLKLQAPPGEILDAESYLSGIPDRENLEKEKTLTRADGKNVAYGGSMGPLDDGNPRDGSFSILETFHLFDNTEVTFDEEGIWKLHYRNFDACYDSGETKIVMEGAIDFDIVFTKISNEEITVISEPVPYSFKTYASHDAYLESQPDYTEGFITSLTLRTMSATMTVEGGNEAVGFLEIPIIMEDGSQVKMQARSFGTGTYNYTFQAPIVMEDVDHILLEDGTKLYLPTE